jgi:hypothetical protein
MPERDDLDRLLDSALSTYAAPDADLEERVLRSLSSERGIVDARRSPHRMRRWLSWAIAIPLAAALGFFLISTPRTPRRAADRAQVNAPQGQVPAAVFVPSESSTARPPARTVHQLRRKTRTASDMAANRALPKQNIFPSPQPLSPEEQFLVAIAAHGPESVRQSLIEAQSKVDAPITISAIEIQPLKMPDPGQN